MCRINAAQVGFFGQILTDQAIGIFVQAALPGLIRVGEIDFCPKFSGNGFMVAKLSAIVGSDGVNAASMRS